MIVCGILFEQPENSSFFARFGGRTTDFSTLINPPSIKEKIMALLQTLISGAGPLPLSANFDSQADVDVAFFVSGSAWSQSEGQLSIQLLLDGNPVGEALGYTNESASHKALVSVFLPSEMTLGSHEVTLQVGNGNTITDLNDNFQVVLIY